jgi:pimeloyl-ACP methyl ester carboxylesterase
VSLPGRFVDTTCGRVFVHRAGRGEPLVIIHGFFCSHWYFRRVLDRLAEKHDVIALDLPGFGESDRPAPDKFNYDLPAFTGIVAEVMDALGVARADVLGHSMGGGVALTLAARRPERVGRLVLCCATVYPLPLPVEGKLLLQPVVGPLLYKHAFRKADIKRLMIRDEVRDPRFADDEFIDYYWARFNRPGGRDATYACILTLAGLDPSSADPGRVTAPTLILWADEDRVVPLAHGKRLQRAIAGAELRVVPASGHMPFIERPEEFLRQLEPFLDGPARAAEVAPVPAGRSRAS